MNELTEEKLNELEEMYEAATSGPWRVGNWIEEEKLHLIYSQPKGQLEHLIARTCFAPQSHQNATLISEMQEHLQSLISAARDSMRYREAMEDAMMHLRTNIDIDGNKMDDSDAFRCLDKALYP